MKNKDRLRHERRQAQLGMSYGTARARLTKQLLLKYVIAAGDNVCHVCSNPITEVSELSVEHIIPWEGRDTNLFWDLNNIRFSHILCNKPHSYGRNK